MNEFISLDNAIRILKQVVYELGLGKREYAQTVLECTINDLKRLAK